MEVISKTFIGNAYLSLYRFFKKNKRNPCPFYGFDLNLILPILSDTHGTQCPLISNARTSYSPCGMELRGKKPDWNNCNIPEKSLLLSRINTIRVVIPEETKRKKVSFEHWKDYVMN